MNAGMECLVEQKQWTDEEELQARVPSRHSDNFDDLVALGDYFSEQLRKNNFDISFLNTKFSDVHSWRVEALEKLKKALVLPVHPCSNSSRVLDRRSNVSHFSEEVEFQSAFGLPIPATVLIPRNAVPPFPAIVALHDMGGFRAFGREKLIPFEGEPSYLTEFRRQYYDGKSIALELVEQGFLVICIDSMMFGERTPLAERDRKGFKTNRQAWTQAESEEFSMLIAGEYERSAAHSALLVGKSWAGMIASDDLATVDYLVTRSDVDADRIGCIGLSYGAYRANYLAALDERVATAVSVCWTATLDSIVGYNVRGAMGYFTHIPGIHTKLDLCDISSLACPKPFLAISGWNDHLMHPSGVAMAHLKLREIWEKAGAADRLGSLCFDSPHEFNVSMQERAFDWLQYWLSK